jgi:hypothetical protein
VVVLTRFTVDIQTIAAVLGILAIVCPFGLWLFGKIGNRLTPAEVEILVAAAKEGQIWLLKVDAFGQWVRADDHDFFDEKDPAFMARYNEAFTRLCSRGHNRLMSSWRRVGPSDPYCRVAYDRATLKEFSAAVALSGAVEETIGREMR